MVDYFWDSYAVIELINGNPNYARFLEEPVIITLFNLAEIYWFAINEYDENAAEDIYEKYRLCIVDIDDETLRDAIKEIKAITKSEDPNNWKWGKYHTLTFENLFSKALPVLSPFTNVGPVQVGGDRDTVSAFGTNNNLKVVWGPSARVIFDLKDLNKSYVQLPLGTSAQIGSPYYKDQAKDWFENNYEPFVYDEALITNNSKETLVLKP